MITSPGLPNSLLFSFSETAAVAGQGLGRVVLSPSAPQHNVVAVGTLQLGWSP